MERDRAHQEEESAMKMIRDILLSNHICKSEMDEIREMENNSKGDSKETIKKI